MDLKELRERQGWSLDKKIDHSLYTIETFLGRLDGKAYVGFSGGKDSTVLLDLCRIIKPDIKAVFCNTGNEYPDIVRFVRELKNTEGYNIEIIYPKMKPREVFEKYGFPLVSKETSMKIDFVRRSPNAISAQRWAGESESIGCRSTPIPLKWRYLIKENYSVSHLCCKYLKKDPMTKYQKESGMFPILGIMACESEKRTTDYLMQGGCNVFGETGRVTKSHPLSIWLEDDIWAYIKKRNLKIADIYYKGAKRTGCMFCMYGAHFKDDNRLELCYNLYPKMYNMFMNYTNNGVTYREAARKVLAVCNKELPDEKKQLELNLDYYG